MKTDITQILLISFLLYSCSESSLEPIPPEPVTPLNQYLNIQGKYCADPPEEKAFPVKILFVIDQSTSLQCTDSQNRRVQTLNQLVNRLSLQSNVHLGFVGFANWSRLQPFTQNPQDIQTFLDPAQGLGPATDYQGALSSALQVLENDMIESGPALRARTKYVVIFMSDGSPEPKCRLGCEDDKITCGDGIDNDGDALIDGADDDCEDVDDNSKRPDNLYGVCNTDSEIPDGIYVDMSGRCPAYNQPEQIQKKIEDLKTLEKLYGLGDLTLHTILLSSPQMVIESVCPMASESFGYNTDLARELLSQMAQKGGGSFRDVNLEAVDQNFLDFDYGSLKSSYLMRELIAYNSNRIANENEYFGGEADSDGDGLSDRKEFELKTNPNLKDSDIKLLGMVGQSDGYSDGFEYIQKLNGFDPVSYDLPAQRCQSAIDRDGDGLNDCEEEFLGLDPLNEDSDQDFILDGIEFYIGTDPLRKDAEEDLDFDGMPNKAELKSNRNPQVPEQKKEAILLKYKIEELGVQLIPNRDRLLTEERSCYRFELNDIPLVPTRVQNQPKANGNNRIMIYGLSQPLNLNDAPTKARIACLDVYFEGENDKFPKQSLDLSDEAWESLRNELYLLVDQISDCFKIQFANKMQVKSVTEQCLKPKTQIGKYLRSKEEINATLDLFFDESMYLKLPSIASDLFVPLAVFQAQKDCISFRGLEELKNALKVLAKQCKGCDQLKSTSSSQ